VNVNRRRFTILCAGFSAAVPTARRASIHVGIASLMDRSRAWER
jgi:hypothetical protein